MSRPHLALQWTSSDESRTERAPLMLEYGRTWVHPPTSVAGARWITAEFRSDDDHLQPTLEVRGGTGSEQIVRWKFVSPSGRTFTQDAQYVGDWHWRVSFSPTEAGP